MKYGISLSTMSLTHNTFWDIINLRSEMMENKQNQFRFSHVKQGHRTGCMTAKHGGGHGSQRTQLYTLWTQSLLCSLAFSVIVGTGVLFLLHIPSLQQKIKKSSADMLTHTEAVLWHAPSAVSIKTEEAACFPSSEDYSLNKTARVSAKHVQLHG